MRRRILGSSCYPAFHRGHMRVGSPDYWLMMKKRKIWAEGCFSVLKREHCLSSVHKRGLLAVAEECLLSALTLNLKRMAKALLFIQRYSILSIFYLDFERIFPLCQQVPYSTLSSVSIRNLS
ncbi:transposase [Oscillibacter sp.]|uniref:transposase n=1 Tax=Oscillibacter sp. TaxID=1945593 RepID=UPI0033913100